MVCGISGTKRSILSAVLHLPMLFSVLYKNYVLFGVPSSSQVKLITLKHNIICKGRYMFLCGKLYRKETILYLLQYVPIDIIEMVHLIIIIGGYDYII